MTTAVNMMRKSLRRAMQQTGDHARRLPQTKSGVHQPGQHDKTTVQSTGCLKGCSEPTVCAQKACRCRLHMLKELGAVRYRHALATMLMRNTRGTIWKPYEKTQEKNRPVTKGGNSSL
ncbi:hypothetical protein PoB_000905900 [Plakobranchus ocellatus]|uniref:Uncharacterized protein n=1 Tax=Plakobranchus ocellatus TaxID=259542 RepID=A0AAV3YKI5_9GAST|nr:hypothetical protein PoB_000905900 [Plakobranchus ocellatus]